MSSRQYGLSRLSPFEDEPENVEQLLVWLYCSNLESDYGDLTLDLRIGWRQTSAASQPHICICHRYGAVFASVNGFGYQIYRTTGSIDFESAVTEVAPFNR